ncbi:TPA: lipopolysaccharide biosynthesis protein [Streptococcus suis]
MNNMQKSVYFWNMIGNLAAAAVSVLYLLIVSRFSNAKTADDFSMAYAIGNLWVVIGLFQVRNYHGTDVEEHHSFSAYLLARGYSLTLMVATILPYLRLTHYQSSYILVLLIILYRLGDVISDLFQGFFQQRNRLDIAGKNMTIRYSASTIVLVVSLVISNHLPLALTLMAITNLVLVFLLDSRQAQKLQSFHPRVLFEKTVHKDAYTILCNCLPLFINGFLLTYIFNEPKQVIEADLAKGNLMSGMQRDFSILFMPVFFMSLCVLIVRPLITNLAKLWYQNDYQQFRQICYRLVLGLFIGGGLISLLAFYIGTPVLSLLYGVDLTSHNATLGILVFSGILYSLAIVFENLITIFRQQKILVFVYLLLFVFSRVITTPLIANHQLLGAAISFLLTMMIYTLIMGLLTIYLYFKGKKNV